MIKKLFIALLTVVITSVLVVPTIAGAHDPAGAADVVGEVQPALGAEYTAGGP